MSDEEEVQGLRKLLKDTLEAKRDLLMCRAVLESHAENIEHAGSMIRLVLTTGRGPQDPRLFNLIPGHDDVASSAAKYVDAYEKYTDCKHQLDNLNP